MRLSSRRIRTRVRGHVSDPAFVVYRWTPGDPLVGLDTDKDSFQGAPADWFGFEKEEVRWFLDRGCEVLKVCAEPGDLILWDSRTVHYNCLPESDNVRSVLCKFETNNAHNLRSTHKYQC